MSDLPPDGDRLDAVVIGAGPAGSIAARELARRGRRVLLLDKAKFPRYKVCGGCLNLRALAALERAGLGDIPARLGAVMLDRFILAAEGRRAVVPLPGGMAVSRERLDAALAHAAEQSGAMFLDGVRAAPGPVSGDCREVVVRSGAITSRVFAKTVLMTGGLYQNLGEIPVKIAPNSRIGAGVLLDSGPDWCEPGGIYMACGRGGYVGLVRAENNRLNIAAAFDPDYVKYVGGLGLAAHGVLREAGLPAFDLLANVRWRGTPPLTHRAEQVAGEGLMVAGDAAGYVEPFTGEGMAWALDSGLAVANCLNASICEQDWSKTHQRLVGSDQRLCRWLAWGLRRPTAIRFAVRALSIAPGMARSIVHGLNAPRPVEMEKLYEV